MPIGGGKYDEECTEAWHRTGGRLVALAVLEGSSGSGFSVVSDQPHLIATLPDVLRKMADGIADDLKGIDVVPSQPGEHTVAIAQMEEHVRVAKLRLSGLRDPLVASLFPGARLLADDMSRLLDQMLDAYRHAVEVKT